MRLAILGFGLIGGSVARTLHERQGSWQISAWSPTGRGPAIALAEGVIGRAPATAQGALEGAELVVLAAPPATSLAMLDDLAGPWRGALAPDTVITDVVSTKSTMVLRATALGLRFVGGHPMAGRETSGYEASSAGLFVDRPWVVVPSGDATADSFVADLARACGARPLRLSAAEHDAVVAAISHLPIIVAAALVEAVAGGAEADRSDWSVAATLAASGWRDTTRVARGDVAMGVGIAVTNGPAISARLRDLIAVLEAWAEILDAPGTDPDAIASRLANARARLLAMPG